MNYWELIDGDNTLLINFDLDENSIVFDFGGYKGDWALKIFKKYNSFIKIYEPIKEFYDSIINRFKNNDKITVINKALHWKESIIIFGVNKSDSGLFCDSKIKEIVTTVNVIDELNNIDIDLLKINIEGMEYLVLDHILRLGEINKIKNILIQFHPVLLNEEIKEIQEKLFKTHKLIFSFPYIWEYWRLK